MPSSALVKSQITLQLYAIGEFTVAWAGAASCKPDKAEPRMETMQVFIEFTIPQKD